MNEHDTPRDDTTLSARAASLVAWLRTARVPITPATAGIVILALVAVIGAAILPGLTLTRVTPETPLVRVDEHLTVRLVDERDGRVGVRVTPFDDAAGQRQKAADNLPAGLEAVSPMYDMRARGGEIQIEMTSEEAADLYVWNARRGTWDFVPVTRESARGLIVGQGPTQIFALLGPADDMSALGTTLPADARLDPILDTYLDFAIVDDSVLTDESGDRLPDEFEDLLVLARVQYDDADVFAAITAEGTARNSHLGAITDLVTESAADGVVLDFRSLTEAPDADLDGFLEAVGDQLDGVEGLLAIQMPRPAIDEEGWETPGYDWAALADRTDILIVTLPENPRALTAGGDADRFLTELTSGVPRSRLYVQFSAMSVDEWAGQTIPIPNEYAIEPLGVVDIAPDQVSALQAASAGDSLRFELVGPASTVGQDAESGLYYYEVFAGGGTHRVWLTTPATLRRRLDWLGAYRFGGIIMDGLAGASLADDVVTALDEFTAGTDSSLDDQVALQWTVTDEAGQTIDEVVTELGDGLVWTPEQPGDYVIGANLAGLGRSDRGALALIVGGDTVGVAPSQEGVVVGAPDSPTGAESGPAPVAIPADMPPPIVPAGNNGNFELGGQVNHVVRNAERMKQAGMTWVKFQLAWGPGTDATAAWDVIERGNAEGFNVLLSITGQEKYPHEIDIEEFNDFLRRVAYYGPEAIEVWNEPNLDFEWPRGRIDGADYTREMLAPAYNAIKSVNPNIMVISAAPAPTGAYYGEGGCSAQGYGCDDWLFLQQMAEAGAANYMDCVGAHFNSGATSPTWNTGHPADPGFQHYSWYYGGMLQLYGGTFGHKVCFTELGFLSGQGLGGVPDRFNWARNTSVADQATWLAEAAQLSRESGQVRLMVVWNVDFTFWGDDPMAGYAIIRPDGSCPACSTLGDVMP